MRTGALNPLLSHVNGPFRDYPASGAYESRNIASWPILIHADRGWVIDGTYQHKLGRLVLEAADLVVWLNLPVRVWLPRLLRRMSRRMRCREPLWNGNRESLRGAFWGRDSLLRYALRMHHQRRRDWPQALGDLPVVRLRTPKEVQRLLAAQRSRPRRWRSGRHGPKVTNRTAGHR